MSKLSYQTITALGLLAISCVANAQDSVPLYKQAKAPVEKRVKDLISRMTLEEKARQLDMYAGKDLVDDRVDDTHAAAGSHINASKTEKVLAGLGAGSIHDLYPTPELYNELQGWVIKHSRLGIPALFLEEGLHGYLGLEQTIYPTSLNLATTWDPELATLTTTGIAAEARSHGVGMLLGPVLDVARDPRWGRIEEDFGEDPFLTGTMGAAYVRGMQGSSIGSDHNVIAEPKHFAGHGSPESGNNTNPVHAGEREIRTIMLRSFEPSIREGNAMGVMAAYHEMDGVPCAGNYWLLTDVLRKEWGFKGFVLSDLGAIGELWYRHHVAATEADAVRLAVSSGVDMQFYDFGHKTFQDALVDGVKTGKMKQAVLDQAVSRVLRVKFELGLFDRPFVDTSLAGRVVRSSEHLDVALRSARESMCLLKNDKNLLPLSKTLKNVVVIGPNGDELRLGDYTPGTNRKIPSVLDGVKAIVSSETKVGFNNGENVDEAVALAKGADVVIVALGEREGISGEGSDRSDLNLPGNQQKLLEAVHATGVPVVLVLQNGRPLTIPWAAEHVPSILEAWYPGERGGQAIAETLFGDNNPGGKLPISFPRSTGTLPVFYNHDVSKQKRYVDGNGESTFVFGHGLSYTTFKYGTPTVQVSKTKAGPDVTVTVDLSNTGSVEGDEVAQVYLRIDTSSVETPGKALKGFQRVHLKPGETRTLTFHLRKYELEIWSAKKKWEVEPGSYTVMVGGASDKVQNVKFTLQP